MNTSCHIWVSVYFVLTSTLSHHSQWIHLMAVDWNINTTNHARNQNHLSRVYLYHPIIHITYIANLFTCLQVGIDYSFFLWKQLKLRCHVISCRTNEGCIFLQQSIGIIKSGIGGITYLLKITHLFLYITKPSLRQSTCRRFLMKCGILLNIS